MAAKAKDAAGIFVYKVENALFKLYQAMDGPNAAYVNEGEFGKEIRACVSCFYWEKTRHVWIVNKTLAEDDDRALAKIKDEVCVHLAAAAGMEEDKRRYSAQIQADFDKLWQYVRDWLGEESDGRGNTQELLAELKGLVERWEKR